MRKIAFLLATLLCACDSPSEPDDRWAVPENIDYADALGVDLSVMNRTDSGLYWEDVEIRTEGYAVGLADEIRFHYTIWLPDGEMVETTRGMAPLQRDVRLLIPGLAEGVTGLGAGGVAQNMPAMRPGSIRKLVIKPELAWPNGRGPIPPRSTLVMEVEVTAVLRSS